MKPTSIILLLVVTLLFSCKKNTDIKIETQQVNVLKKENGYLVFKDYDEFFSSLLIISDMSKEQRLKFETDYSFKSFYSYAEEVLTRLDKSREKDPTLQNEIISEKNEFVYYDANQSLQLRVQNILESYFMNKDKIIKVGNDYLVYNSHSFLTYKNISYEELTNILRTNNMATSARILVGTAPSTNNYTVTTGNPKLTNSAYSGPAGRIITNLKLYNLNTTTSGNRGFITLVYSAEQKDAFGIYKKAYSEITLLSCGINLKFSDNSTNLIGFWGPLGTGTQPSWTGGSGWNEDILAVSSSLKANQIPSGHPLLTYFSNYSTQITNTKLLNSAQEVNDNAISAINGYWKEINTVTTNPNTQLWIEALSSRSGIFVGTDVFSYRIEEN